MQITFARSQASFIEAQVKAGRYVDAGEVVRAAVRQMEVRQAQLDAQAFIAGHGFENADIEALAFAVLMEAAKSASEDLKQIMAQLKAINAAKAAMRKLLREVRRDCLANQARKAGQRLDFSRGLGSERAYHQAQLPELDPDSPCGVRMVKTDLFAGRILTPHDIDCVAEDLQARLDSLSEMGEMESLRLQMAMDRRSKIMSTISNLLKKQSETAAAITQNIK